MKILIGVPFAFYQPSGSSHNTFFRIKAIVALGHQVDILTYPFGKDVNDPNVRMFRYPSRKIFRTFQPGEYKKKILFDSILLPMLIARTIRQRYDLIILHGSVSWAPFLIRPFTRAKLVANWHSNIEKELVKWKVSHSLLLISLARKYETFITRYYDRLICVNRAVYDLLVSNGVNPDKLTLINNTVITNQGYEPLKSTSRKFIVLYTGTFVKVQNLDLIYQTAARVKNEDIEFWVVGGDKNEVEVERRKIVNIQNVKIFERVEYSRISEIYDQAAILISPRVFGHDAPMKLYDYMARGKCILATDRPIHHELLDYSNSFLFEPTPEKCVDAILLLHSDPGLRSRLGKKAHEDFSMSYSFNKMKDKYSNLFSEIVQ